MPVARGGESFKNPESGMHTAICYACVGLGTQRREFQGQTKSPEAHVKLGFELCEPDDVNGDGSRMTIWTKDLLLNLSDKANLRKLLESWRNRPFTPEELQGFDIAKVVGHPCMLNISINDKYANIVTINPLPKSLPKPDPGRKQVIYEIEHGPNEVFEMLPKWIKDTIYRSLEAEGGHSGWPPAKGEGQSSGQSRQRTAADAMDDISNSGFGDSSGDEVPF